MESVHDTASCSGISKPINLKKMLDEIRDDQLSSHFESGCNLEQVFRKIIIDYDEDFDKMKESIGVRHMGCDTSGKSPFNKNFDIPKENDLQTLKFQKKDVDERCKNEKYATMVQNDMQTVMFPYTERVVKKKERKTSDTITLPELILTVKIYHPTAKTNPATITPNEAQQIKLHPSQEFLVIGHQDLTELRKEIFCTLDQISPGDFSENPDAPCTVTLKDLYPSGFFYVNGTFYNDMRDPKSTDLSKVIREWAETKAHGIGPFTAQLMKGTQFIDLTLQLGCPYVYTHQGDCEHLFVFTDVRAMTQNDRLDRKSYPMVNKYFPKNRTSCMMCQMFTACWAVYGDMLPISPHLICDGCLKGFFYTKDGKKNAEFELRKYCDQSEIV